MIEPTDEMVDAARSTWAATMAQCNYGVPVERFFDMTGIIAAHRDALAAVLAIVERDYAIGPQGCVEPTPGEPMAYCELARGHRGKHTATVERAVDW